MSNYKQLDKNIYEYKSIEQINLDLAEAAKIIYSQNCIIVKDVIKEEYCNKAIKYLERISKSSFPNYFSLIHLKNNSKVQVPLLNRNQLKILNPLCNALSHI